MFCFVFWKQMWRNTDIFQNKDCFSKETIGNVHHLNPASLLCFKFHVSYFELIALIDQRIRVLSDWRNRAVNVIKMQWEGGNGKCLSWPAGKGGTNLACGIRRKSRRASQQKRLLNRVSEEDLQSDSQLPGIENQSSCRKNGRRWISLPGSEPGLLQLQLWCVLSLDSCLIFLSIENFMGDHMESMEVKNWAVERGRLRKLISYLWNREHRKPTSECFWEGKMR